MFGAICSDKVFTSLLPSYSCMCKGSVFSSFLLSHVYRTCFCGLLVR